MGPHRRFLKVIHNDRFALFKDCTRGPLFAAATAYARQFDGGANKYFKLEDYSPLLQHLDDYLRREGKQPIGAPNSLRAPVRRFIKTSIAV